MVNGQEHSAVPSTRRQSFAAGVKLRAHFEIPLPAFLLSAFLGLALSYDLQAAWPRLAWIVAGVYFAALIAYLPDGASLGLRGHRIQLLHFLFGILPTAVAVYFLLVHYWRDPHYGEFLQVATLGFVKGQPFDVALSVPASDVGGGVIAAFFPLQIWALQTPLKAGTRTRVAAWTAIGVSLLALWLSGARGAWLALPAVLVVWWLSTSSTSSAWRHGQSLWQQAALVICLGAAAAMLAACLLLLLSAPVREGVLALRPDRVDVWRNSLDLAGDYPLTGVGLGGFTMAYSSYVLLLHVPYTTHAYNLFLDLYLQQGPLGLLAFVSWVALALRPRVSRSAWAPAARAALGVIVLYGLVDDPFFGYGGEAAALAFLPLGLLARNSAVGVRHIRKPTRGNGRRLAAFTAAGGVVVVLLIGFAPHARALLFANAGALAQTRAELSVFSWPAYGIQDELRLRKVVDVDTVAAYYRNALALDPTNVTSNRRLGQIELSLGKYDAALTHLRAAYKAAPQQRATRQLLAEAFAVTGNIDEAATLLRVTDNQAGQGGLRQWWYAQYLRDDERAANLTEAIDAARR